MYFFFNDTATTEIYTLSLHDALPISYGEDDADLAAVLLDALRRGRHRLGVAESCTGGMVAERITNRSEEHTSELQSRLHLVCRLLLEKKKKHNPLSCFTPTCARFSVH